MYQSTDNKNFTHGRAHINNGKLYYYLLQEIRGNERPLYLQVIDLDIFIEPFRVSLTSPFDGETYNVGETIPISADAIDENGSISKVEFRVNGVFYGDDTTAPYSVDWTPNTEGAYTIQAVAYNGSAQTVLSSEIIVNLEVNDPTDLTGDIYNLRNLSNGKYMLGVTGSGAFIESDYVDDIGLNFTFVKVNVGGTDYYNIVNELRGVMRANGSPGTIVNTLFSPPDSSNDKIWTATYNPADGGYYQFSVKDSANYLYWDSATSAYLNGPVTDDRSKWVVGSITLSTNNVDANTLSIKVYPNPANNKFTIAFKGFNNATVAIYDILGKPVYSNSTNGNSIQVEKNNHFKSGIYLIKVVDDLQRVYHTKLVIK